MAAPFVHAQSRFEPTAERLRFGAFAVRALEVPQFVGLEADPEWNEHDIRPIGFYDASVFGRKSRKFLVHQHTFLVSHPVSFIGCRPAAICRGASRVVGAGRDVSLITAGVRE